ncbi:universal stress protein [Urechidicola croceus]|uniref:Universal stress protein UspA n=1 Tax=Urechidicola croceus TaxID=1850246 RepID=A0A1D8P4W4_9FLAO|nr:universal stress protein [Urechidicola croceus]AOW19613.1 universal stress protein UspA [Urechidicola croceus]
MQQFNKVLIGIAFSPSLKANLFEAIRFCNMFNSKLICVHVGKKSIEKEAQLKQLFNQVQEYIIEPKIIWQDGDPVDVILNSCKTHKVDLLIIGATQQEKLLRFYLGSIARKLTRKACCSVLLLIKPSVKRIQCNHIVVNGLEDERTKKSIHTSFYVSKKLDCKKITIVEEINQNEIEVKVNDDKSLRKATILKERIKQRENFRLRDILKDIDKGNISVKTQNIFGKRGYSIGHYAKVVRADLLVMNAPKSAGILDRIFPHDLEYILSELPTDVLIVR